MGVELVQRLCQQVAKGDQYEHAAQGDECRARAPTHEQQAPATNSTIGTVAPAAHSDQWGRKV